MTTNPWDDMARRWRELYEQQAELAKSWMDGQAKLAGSLAGAGVGEGTGTEAAGTEAAAMAELWRSWLTLGGSLGRAMPGMAGMPGMAAMPGMAEPGRVAGETLGRFLDPLSLALVGGSQVGEAIRRMTEGPRFADLGAIERRMAGVMERWFAVQTAARAYEGVVAAAWAEANQRFGRELQERALAGNAVTRPKDALKLWLDIANQTLLETHRSERFLQAQGELLRHGMDFLLAERAMVESLVEPAGLPTRTEIDEVHRSVQELKRRVRTLERAAAAAELREPAASEPAPAASRAARRKADTAAPGAPP